MKEIINIDCDGVLRDVFPRYVAAYEEFYGGHHIGRDDITQYNIFDIMPGLPTSVFEDHADFIFMNAKPFVGVKQGLEMLKKAGFYLQIVSAQPPKAAYTVKAWLEKHNLPYDNIIITHDKGSVKGNYAIEDYAENLKVMQGKKFLIDHPYNREEDVGMRVTSFIEMCLRLTDFKRVVLFNGPPSSGKDTFGDMLIDEFGGHKQQFKEILFDIASAITGNSAFWRSERYNAEKGKPVDWCFDLTPRQLLIKISEDVIKPNFGEDFFGQAAKRKMQNGLNVFCDSGFVAELRPIIDEVGAENTIVFRLHRKHCDYKGDSRNYLTGKDFPGVIFVDVVSDDIDKTYAEIKHLYEKFVTQ